MSIRPADIDDVPVLLLLAAKMHGEAPAYRDFEFDTHRVDGLLRRLITGAGCLLVSEVNGRVVGGIAGICTEHWFSPEKVAVDLALFIDPEYRNGMSAARLVDGFIQWAKLAGAKRVTLGVTTGVHPQATGRLYQACGLHGTGELYSRDFH